MAKIYYSSMRNKSFKPEQKNTQNGVVVYGYLILLVSFSILLIAYIWEYHEVLDLFEELRQKKLEIADLNEKTHMMSVEIAALCTRPRIQSIAMTKLNLSYPPLHNVVWYKNPNDRFNKYQEPDNFFARSKLFNQLFTIGSVEAGSSK